MIYESAEQMFAFILCDRERAYIFYWLKLMQ